MTVNNITTEINDNTKMVKPILGRAACLGKWVLERKLKGMEYTLVNQQKTRVDLLLDWIDGAQRPCAAKVKPHMERQDVYCMIEEQEMLPWFEVDNSAGFVLMDSFSELTDQKFTKKKGNWSFCCAYSDLKHTEEFDRDFECEGLLELAGVEALYDKFFQWFAGKYPDKKVYFIHFSTKYDERENFKRRSSDIFQAMINISKKFPFIINLKLDESFVLKEHEDEFPYHYSNFTYDRYVDIWK